MDPFDPSIFQSHGLRRTRQREVLYTALAASTAHPTAEELHHLVQPAEPGLSLATVYNTLETFERVGLCRSIATGNAPRRYDADTRTHVHMLTHDGRVLDVPHDLGHELLRSIEPGVLRRIEAALGVPVGHVSLQLSEAIPDPSPGDEEPEASVRTAGD